jgi:hypothetical protein
MKLERAEKFSFLGFILNENNTHQINLQKINKNANKTQFMLQTFFQK